MSDAISVRRTASKPTGLSEKILIACKDDGCRRKMQRLLTDQAFLVHIVQEDANLLLQLLKEDYALVIYDLEISILGGVNMVKILRRVRPKIPLVVLTNDASTERGGKVLQEGILYYGLKPVNLTALSCAVVAKLR